MNSFLPLVALFAIRLAPGIAFQAAAVAAPLMIRELHFDHAQAGLVLGAFMLPGIVVTVPAGMLARRIGDRPVLCGGLALVIAGMLLAGTMGSLAGLVAARVLAGIGGASLLMLLIKMTADRYVGPNLSIASSVIITSWPVGLALGLVLLGMLGTVATNLGWRAVLAFGAVPALLALALIPLTGRAGEARGGGPAAATAANTDWRFVFGAVLSWSLLNGMLPVLVGFLPGYFLSLGRPLEGAAASASLFVWCSAAAIPLGGVAADRLIGRPRAIIAGAIATAALLLALPAVGGPLWLLAVAGCAFSLAPGPLTAQLGQGTPSARRAVVFGWYSAGSYVAMTVSPWLAGWLRDVTSNPAAPILLAAACSIAMLVPYALMLNGARRGAMPAATAPA